MRIFDVDLKSLYPLKGGKLTCYVTDQPFDDKVENFTRPALVVCPGGGYWYCSKREQEPVSSYFVYSGFQVFVLNYLCAQDKVCYPEQLYELGASVDYIRKNAKTLNVNPDKVFVCGFSAGGHLVANLSNEYQKADTYLNGNTKPTAVGLGYPVISYVGGHEDSFNNLLFGLPDEEKIVLVQKLSMQNMVSKNTPPTFIWTTAKDSLVPPQNSLMYALSLANKGVEYEIHVYPNGGHGLSSCSTEINAPSDFLTKNSSWLKDMSDFFKQY